MKTHLLIPLLVFIAILSSCAPTLVGTWTIGKYQTISPDKKGVTLDNIGTMTFHRNGTGVQNVDYSILGAPAEGERAFSWTAYNDGLITIKSKGADFSKTWIQVENKRKFQQLKSTDGINEVQVLELRK